MPVLEVLPLIKVIFSFENAKFAGFIPTEKTPLDKVTTEPPNEISLADSCGKIIEKKKTKMRL